MSKQTKRHEADRDQERIPPGIGDHILTMLKASRSRRWVANRLAEIIDYHGDALELPEADKE